MAGTINLWDPFGHVISDGVRMFNQQSRWNVNLFPPVWPFVEARPVEGRASEARAAEVERLARICDALLVVLRRTSGNGGEESAEHEADAIRRFLEAAQEIGEADKEIREPGGHTPRLVEEVKELEGRPGELERSPSEADGD